MTIIKTNIDTADKKEVYRMTRSTSQAVQDAPDGLSVPVKAWMLYDDPKVQKDGIEKEKRVLSIIDTSGVKYTSISATFIREFMDIAALMEQEPFAIIFIHGTTKGGKAFVSCELDCDYTP